MIINLIGIIISVLTTNYILFDFLDSVYPIKDKYENKKKQILTLAFIAYSLIIVIINILQISTVNMVANLFCFIMISIVFFKKISLKQMIITNIIFMISLIIGEVIVMFIINILINQLSIENIDINIYSFLKTTMFSLFIFSVFRLLKIYFIKSRQSTNLKQNFILMIFLPLFSIMIIYLLIILDNVIESRIIMYLSLIISFGLLLLNIYLLRLFDYLYENNDLKMKLEFLQKQTEIQLSYYEAISSKQKEMRHFVHDVKRHMQAIYDLYYANEDDAANDYVRQLYKLLETSNNSFTSNNKVLEVLINDKIERAKNQNIQLNVIDNSTSNLDFIDKIDLVLIMSNLIDNAIDATSECITKKINLTIDDYNNFTLIVLQNPYTQINRDNYKLYTTKQNHQGLGLEIIEKTVRKYNGDCSYEMENNLFNYTVLFPLSH